MVAAYVGTLLVLKVLDTKCELFEVVIPDFRVLQVLVVQHEILDDGLLEFVRGPLAKAHGHRAANSEAQCQDHVSAVEFHLANHLSVAL